MKHPFHSHILPYFSVGAGILGFLLRLWLFSAVDEKGLLPVRHFANYAVFVLSALVMLVLYLSAQKLRSRPVNRKAVRLCNGFACMLGAAGFLLGAVTQDAGQSVRLSWLTTLAVPVGSIAFLLMAVLCFTRRKIHYVFPATVTVTFMLHTVTQCQIWGAVPQLQVYFFPLLASVFLILCAYQCTALAAGEGSSRLLAFFSQGALYFCCLSLNTSQWPLYLGMGFWAAVQLYCCIPKRKEA